MSFPTATVLTDLCAYKKSKTQATTHIEQSVLDCNANAVIAMLCQVKEGWYLIYTQFFDSHPPPNLISKKKEREVDVFNFKLYAKEETPRSYISLRRQSSEIQYHI